MNDRASPAPPVFLPMSLHAEWDLLVHGHHNVLLVGTPSASGKMLMALKPHFRVPLHEHTPPADGPVPQPADGTLLLADVARLDAKQQTDLLQWLDELSERPVQVVSTASESLFPLVQAGAFDADLYYKLNVVLMDLTAAI